MNVRPGSASTSTCASLPDADAGELALVDGDEDAQHVDARDGDDRAAARRPDQRPGIEPALHDHAVERRADARLAQADGHRGDLRLRRLLRGLGGRELGLRLLQLLLRHHRLGRELLGALVVGARERRRRLRLRQRAARRRELVGQIARAHQRQQLPALDAIAAIDEHRVEVAERLRPDVGLDQRPQVDRGAHLDRDVARLDPRDRHQRRRADLRLVRPLAATPARQDAETTDEGRGRQPPARG